MKWVICASGPSMASVDVTHLRRFRSWRVMAVNCTWQLVPWAQVLYAGDRQWWDAYGHAVDFRGERWTRSERSAIQYGCNLVRGVDGFGLCRTQGAVTLAGNSGYQAINLAWHFGARTIVLLGFDMHRENGAHWHGDHVGMLSAPEQHITQWRQRFPALARDLRDEGVRVINATEGSALDCFERMPMTRALRC